MPNAITNYFHGAYDELKKVVWPTRRETIQHTAIVIGLSLGIAVLLGALDYAFNFGLEWLLLGR